MKKILIDKYLDGETSLTEEQELLRLLQGIPSDLRTGEERAILLMLSCRVMSQETDIFTSDLEDEYDRIVSRRKRRMWWKYAGIAAAVALFVIVGTIGFFRNVTSEDNLAVAYVYGTETTDEELVMSMMKNTMAEVFSCSTSDEKLYELFNPE